MKPSYFLNDLSINLMVILRCATWHSLSLPCVVFLIGTQSKKNYLQRIGAIPYCLWTNEEKKNNKRQSNKSMRSSHSKHCFMPLYRCMLVQSYILLTSIGYGPTMQVKYLEIWLHLSLRRRSWGVGASERWRCPRVQFVIVSISLFLLLLECIFDAKTCDLSFLSVERFIWDVWRCLDFKIWIEYFKCSRISLRALNVFRLQ